MSKRAIVAATLASLCLVAMPSAYGSGLVQIGANGPSSAALVSVDENTQTVVASSLPFGGLTAGIRVAACDVNADGTPDVIVAPGPGAPPRVLVLDGRSGAAIADFYAFSAGYTGGIYVAGGDVNGDGHCDIIVAPDAGPPPEVKVFSGRNGNAVLADFYAYPLSVTGGVRVAAADVDHDGLADIVTGPGPGHAPQVRVYKMPEQSLLHDFYAFDMNFIGGVYVAAADLNLDGHADLVVGTGNGGAPLVTEFSGVDLAVISSFLAFDAGFTGGVRVAAGDGNGDGIAEVAFATGPGATQVKLTYLTSPAPTNGFLPLGASTDGSFVAIAPRSDTIFSDHYEAH